MQNQTIEALETQRAELESKINAMRQTAIEDAKALIAEFGITPEELSEATSEATSEAASEAASESSE